MLAQHEREDTLALLSLIAQGLGHKRLREEYQTPREMWEETVDRLGWAPGDLAAERQAEVAAFLAVAEG